MAEARAQLAVLIDLGMMSEAEAARAAEVLLDITWLAAEGYISVEDMSERTNRAAQREIARLNARRAKP